FLLLGFLGAGGFTALWLREVGTPRGASLAVGLAFAMAPYLQAQWSAGHLLAWIAMLLPLSLYGLERARKGSDCWLFLAGGPLVLRRRWGMAPLLALGALIPILFALGGNLPGYHFIWEHGPGLRHTRVPERMMPVACLALAALVAVAISRLGWPGIAIIVALL